MKNLLHSIQFTAPHKTQVRYLMLLIAVLYLFNFHVNDIWTPNESFYAESVREMFESGNFIDIQYNYRPRYNKPPLTYWAIALSSAIFGLNEFGIRLPMILMALGSIWLTYLLGKKLYGPKAGLYAMCIMAVSVQLIAVKQYASPEVPLTFFFTLTMYWFIRAYTENKNKYYYLAYVALGLTVLTKGYPYIIVIGGIIGFYLLLDSQFNLKVWFKKLLQIKLHIGIPIVLVIGLSWVIYMYFTYGQDFWRIFQHETFERAFTRDEKSMRPFFYVEVISWTILPYSLAFFVALGYYLFSYKNIRKEIGFAFSWFIVMFIIFTAAKGKIPTYFIQAHPPMALILTAFLINKPKLNKPFELIRLYSFLLPALLILGASFALVYLFSLSIIWYIVPLLVSILIFYLLRNNSEDKTQSQMIAIPFYAIIGVYLLLGAYLKPLELFRPYKNIGEIIKSNENIAGDTPLQIDGTLIHNMPFYAERKVIRQDTLINIIQYTEPILALIREEHMSEFTGAEVLWEGYIYDFASESQFAKFIKASLKAEKGDYSDFAIFKLIYRP
ncbi:ArnT family glycosyltransferase [Roseivirga seohaensis]|uniref:ArnT family glycosyltransferase n=1 Tax=Roseivirga seohaensis TaxID=1914963 RepID=UPI003BAD2BF8